MQNVQIYEILAIAFCLYTYLWGCIKWSVPQLQQPLVPHQLAIGLQGVHLQFHIFFDQKEIFFVQKDYFGTFESLVYYFLVHLWPFWSIVTALDRKRHF